MMGNETQCLFGHISKQIYDGKKRKLNDEKQVLTLNVSKVFFAQ